jgi:hypothetical protein
MPSRKKDSTPHFALDSDATPQALPSCPSVGSRVLVFTVLLAGWIVPHLMIYGPALVGHTVLLPLDLLALPEFYLPRTNEFADVVPQDEILTDLITIYPLSRDFAAREIRQGRLPLWDPQSFAGTPFCWTIFAVFEVAYHLFPWPTTMAWMQLAQGLVVGLGTYLFARQALEVSFWPAAVASWCAPWSGFLVLWQGFPLTASVVLLPWVLLATDQAVRRPWSAAPVVLSLSVAVMVLSGAIDITGLALMLAGMYAIWKAVNTYWQPPRLRRIAVTCGATLAAIVVGVMLSGPWLLHFAEHIATGSRMARRAAGSEERPPGGLWALPQVVLPDVYGRTMRGWIRTAPDNHLESTATAYIGLTAAVFLAPLVFIRRRARGQVVFWCLVSLLGVAWGIGLPVLVLLMRLPPSNLFSYARFTFATSFGVLSLAAIGLDVLLCDQILWRRWFLAPILLATAITVWMGLRAVNLPEPIGAGAEAQLLRGETLGRITDLDGLQQVRQAFTNYGRYGCCLSCLAGAGWLAVRKGAHHRRWFRAAVCTVWMAEMIFFAHEHRRQSDPRLYYPRVRALDRLKEYPAGRVLGVYCLPPKLNEAYQLDDVRGYDGVDPAPIVELLELARLPGTGSVPYARTQWFVPKVFPDGDDLRVSPILDMLGVRYLIHRRPPPAGFPVLIHEDDYWIVENRRALPRVFVPQRVTALGNHAAMYSRLAQPDFDARQESYVEQPLDITAVVEGEATIVSEDARHGEVEATMQTAGLVVLADSWHPGWQATLDGQVADVLRVNTLLRGIFTPPGRHRIVFSYRPASFRIGLLLMYAAIVAIGVWLLVIWLVARTSRQKRPT